MYRNRLVRFMYRNRLVRYKKNRSIDEYAKDIRKSLFVLSPAGNGIESHRTWESIILGAIPIIRPVCKLDNDIYCEGYKKLYEDLPVVVVSKWEEVTNEFLKNKLKEFEGKTFNFRKLYYSYWRDLVMEKVCEYKERK